MFNVLGLVLRTILSLLRIDEDSAMMRPPGEHLVGVPLVRQAKACCLRVSRSQVPRARRCALPRTKIIAVSQVFCHIFNTTKVVLFVRVGAQRGSMRFYNIVESVSSL